MSEKLLIVVRGIPGSGKTWETEKLRLELGIPYDQIFSADNYWIRDVLQEIRAKEAAGEEIDHAYYKELLFDTYRANWNHEKLGQAHGWNFTNFKIAVFKALTPLIVDNVNAKARDMRGYVELAEKNGYKIRIQEPTSPWWLEHAPMFYNKQANGTALEDFARFLAGFHEGMAAKYGARGNQHGVPLDTIRAMIRKFQPNLTVDDIMGRSGRFTD